MPRQPRLDAPGTLQHVILRGLERAAIFRDDVDRAAFVARMGEVATTTQTTIYAWALLPNHAHLLLRSGPQGLPQFMRRVLTGYALAYNRRHRRVGHVFQNRYKSIVVEEESYFRELVRYIHLNPLRARLVPDLRVLDRYPWAGHSALLGSVSRPWQATGEVLAQFGPTHARARRAYRVFVAGGASQGRRPELQGGGLLRSAGGWTAVAALRRGREAYLGDERVLGGTAFVEQVRREIEAASPSPAPRLTREALLGRVCRHVGIAPKVLLGGGRSSQVTRARAGIAYLWVEVLGHAGRPLAASLGSGPSQCTGPLCGAARRVTSGGAC